MADNTYQTVFEIAGELDASFPASFRQAVSEIDRVNNSLKMSPQNMQALDSAATKSLSTIGKMAAAGTALASAFFLAADAIAQSDMRIKSLAESVGMSAQQAENLGASVAPMGFDFETIVDMQEELNNKIGESKGLEEITAVTESLQILGLKYEDIKKLSPEKQFEAVANAALKAKDAQKAVAAMDMLMGGESNRVMGFWRSQGFQSVDEAAGQFGALNARTDASREGMEDFAVAMNSVKFFVGSLTKEFFGLVGGALTPMINGMSQWAAANKEVIAGGIAEFAQSVGEAFKFISENWETIKDITRFAFNFIATFAALTLALKTFRTAMMLVNLVMAINPFVAIGLGIMAVIAGVNALVQHFGGWGALWNGVKTTISNVWNAITGTIRGAIQAIDNVFANNPILNFIVPIIGIPRIIIAHWGALSGFFSGLWATITGIVAGAWNGLVSLIVNSTLYSGIVNLWNNIIMFLSGLGSRMTEIGSNIINGLINGIMSGFERLKSIWNTVNSYIPDFARKKMDIHSPSRVMAEIGGHITAGLGVGIEGGQQGLTSSMNNTLGSLTQTAKPLAASVGASAGAAPQSAAVTLIQNITVGSQDAFNAAKQGAAEGVRNFQAEYEAMMRKQARTAF